VIAVDIDDTVLSTDGHPEYLNPKALPGALDANKKIWDAGYKVDFFTARHTKYYDLTVEQLDQLGFRYRRLITSKPLYDKFIDDRAIEFKGDWKTALDKLMEKRDD